MVVPRLPGKARYSLEVKRVFWRAVAAGMDSRAAAGVAGAGAMTGATWFREAGGMSPLSLDDPSGRYLLFEERERIALLLVSGNSIREIARRIGRSPSTVSREIRRNGEPQAEGGIAYVASRAQRRAENAARRPKETKLAGNRRLCRYVTERLAGEVAHPDGSRVSGPGFRRSGWKVGPRKDRRWAWAWSPEQISNRLPLDFPDDESMRISPESIYRSLFIQGRGELKRELTHCLRSGRTLRVPRRRKPPENRGFVTDEILIGERPPEAEDRAVPGHWEGDLIVGQGRSTIGTLVERSSRLLMLLHLPPLKGKGSGAEAVRDAVIEQFGSMPHQLKQTLTWDQGAEMARHHEIRVATDLAVYFCDPKSPWQRPTNENTNGLLRQYFPKGTDLTRWTRHDLEAVAYTLNNRPRKVLGWKTPAEVFADQLTSTKTTRVATTD